MRENPSASVFMDARAGSARDEDERHRRAARRFAFAALRGAAVLKAGRTNLMALADRADRQCDDDSERPLPYCISGKRQRLQCGGRNDA